MPPASGIPAADAGVSEPSAFLRWLGAGGAGAMPSLDELAELSQHLQALRGETDVRLSELATERGSGRAKAGAPLTPARIAQLRGRAGRRSVSLSDSGHSEGSPGSSDADWELDDAGVAPQRAGVHRTYGRGRQRPGKAAAPAKVEEPSSSELDDLESSEDDASATLVPPKANDAKGSAQGPAQGRTSLGVKLKVNPAASQAKKPRESVGALRAMVPTALPMDEEEIFDDDTKFSWAPPEAATTQLLPQAEPIRVPRPYATHPTQVNEDFANRDWRDRDAGGARASPAPGQAVPKDAGRARPKDTSQVPINTFYHYADAFFKPVTEDDLAWLSSKADDPSPFQMPELGQHYRQVWEKEDAELLGGLGAPSDTARPPAPTWAADGPAAPGVEAVGDARTLSLGALTDEHLYRPGAWPGPLLERLASSLLAEDAGDAAADAEGRPGSEAEASAVPSREKPLQDAEAEAEKRAEELGILDAGVPPWGEAADDPIASALRQAQSLLRQQMRTNERRKARLFRVAVDRMAYQDYRACLQGIEREIEAGWTKRMRQIKASMGKRRKNAPSGNSTSGAADTSSPSGTGAEAAVGPARPVLPETLTAALERRRRLKSAFEPMFRSMPHASSAPVESIYQGLDP